MALAVTSCEPDSPTMARFPRIIQNRYLLLHMEITYLRLKNPGNFPLLKLHLFSLFSIIQHLTNEGLKASRNPLLMG